MILTDGQVIGCEVQHGALSDIEEINRECKSCLVVMRIVWLKEKASSDLIHLDKRWVA